MIASLVMQISNILVIGVRCGESCLRSDQEDDGGDCFYWEGCSLNMDNRELKTCLHAGLLLTNV